MKVALIGFGGIAHAAHLPAYLNLERKGKAKLVAVCDIDPERFSRNSEAGIAEDGAPDAGSFRTYTDLEEMLARETFDVADICLPTPFHAPTAIRLLRAGKHVLCEKPMARTYVLCREMTETALAFDRKLMIGQCLRFFPEYIKLKEYTDTGVFGKPLAATFRRLSSPPVWGWDNWYMDAKRSGGVIQDLSIHDLDMARNLFGEPRAVSCIMMGGLYSDCDSAVSTLYYDGFSVLTVGDWSLEGADFTADFRVSFEKATVEFSREVLTVYPRGGEKYTVPLEENLGYQDEIEYFIGLVESGGEDLLNPPLSAAMSVRLVERLRESAAAGGQKLVYRA